MPKAKAPTRAPRGKEANPRKFKKKTSPLLIDKVEFVDYKDVDLLNRFLSDRAKIRGMRISGNDRQQQLEVANAIKIARELALLPYAKRVSSAGRTRPPRDGDRERRGPREERGAAAPTRDSAAVEAQGDESVDVETSAVNEQVEV